MYKIFILLCPFFLMAQETPTSLPYYELPEAPNSYTAGTVASRQVDALGFRFYWATHNLNATDLAYKPNDQSRTVFETIKHIYDLSNIILNATLKQPNKKIDYVLTYAELRSGVLLNLKRASNILKSSKDISAFQIIFGENKIPYWNTINGPISDSVWHCGQIASFRRITGNPINSKVNHFTGKVRN